MLLRLFERNVMLKITAQEVLLILMNKFRHSEYSDLQWKIQILRHEKKKTSMQKREIRN